jgi:hypothetical protein
VAKISSTYVVIWLARGFYQRHSVSRKRDTSAAERKQEFTQIISWQRYVWGWLAVSLQQVSSQSWVVIIRSTWAVSTHRDSTVSRVSLVQTSVDMTVVGFELRLHKYLKSAEPCKFRTHNFNRLRPSLAHWVYNLTNFRKLKLHDALQTDATSLISLSREISTGLFPCRKRFPL